MLKQIPMVFALALTACAGTPAVKTESSLQPATTRKPAGDPDDISISKKLQKLGIVRFYCHTEPPTGDDMIFAQSASEASSLYLFKIKARLDSGRMLATGADGRETWITDFSCQ